jgi:hypothetical protein
MSKPEAKQPKFKKCRSFYVFEAFEQFIDRHLLLGGRSGDYYLSGRWDFTST